MGQIQINELPEALSAADSDLLAIDNGVATKKITIENFNANANATAKYYAEQAEGFATTASNAKDDAVAAKNEAVLQVSNAHDEATAAAGSATDAAGSASSASGYANTARIQAGNAAQSAQSAANSAVGIDDKVKMAQSWAEGNTGARVDEATNNAKYWAGVARSVAGGGVIQFNGRDGEVLPESGDYDSSMIAHTKVDGTVTNVETELVNKLDSDNIAPVENNSTISLNYSPGEEFIRNDILYKAKTYISSGTLWSDLVLNTDYELSPNITTQLKAVASSVGDISQLATTNKSDTVVAINELVANMPDEVTIGYTGTASDTSVRYQRIGIGDVYTEINGTKYMEQTVTLSTSGTTTATFTNAAITSDSVIEPYYSEYGFAAESIVTTNGQSVLTLPKVDTAISLTVRIYIK